MYNSSTIRAFNEISSSIFKDQLKSLIKKEINGQNKEYILNIEEVEYLDYLKNEFTIKPLRIHNDTEVVESPITVKEK